MYTILRVSSQIQKNFIMSCYLLNLVLSVKGLNQHHLICFTSIESAPHIMLFGTIILLRVQVEDYSQYSEIFSQELIVFSLSI